MRKRHYKYTAVILVVMFISMLAVGCSNDNDTPTETDNEWGSVHNLPVMDDGGFYEFLDSHGAYEVGSAIPVDDLRLAFLDYDTDGHGYDEVLKPADGNRIIRAFFRMSNQSSEDVEFGSNNFVCSDSDDNTYKSIPVYARDSMATKLSIIPGETTEGWVYFEVPKNRSRFEVTYDGTDSPVFVIDGSIQLF